MVNCVAMYSQSHTDLPQACASEAMHESLFKPTQLQAKVRDYRARALQVTDPAEREWSIQMARSYVLLSMNAAWIVSTDEFLTAVKKDLRWPHGRLATSDRMQPGCCDQDEAASPSR